MNVLQIVVVNENHEEIEQGGWRVSAEVFKSTLLNEQ